MNLSSSYLYFFILVVSFRKGHSASQRRTCNPLLPNANVQVTCTSSKFIESNLQYSDCSQPQDAGTTATFKCKEYFSPIEVGRGKSQPLRCGGNGEWIGINKFQVHRCKEDCGNAQGIAKPLVVNGVPTYRSSHPWQAMLFVRGNNNDWVYLCGGSIIRSLVLLTAAHCIVSHAEKYRVVVGGVSTNYSQNTVSTGALSFSVTRFYISENYDPNKGYQADLALVQVSEAINYNEYISPVCLPDDYSVDVGVIRNGVSGQIAGFGLTENGTMPDTLRVIKLVVRSSSECYNYLHRRTSESQFCASSQPGGVFQTVCNGDSGNGFTFFSPVHEKFYVHGLVSSSDSDARKGICQSVAVFTRIYPFVFWIRDVLEEISGHYGNEISSIVPYPYVLQGSEVHYKVYRGLPSEWENRVTNLELHNVYVKVNDLLTSLESAKTLRSIQLRQVVMNTLPTSASKLYLPLLTAFTLDLPRPDLPLLHDLKFPEPLTETYLKSVLFFYQDYTNPEWKLADILTLKIDIDITLHIFKVVHINITRGEFYVNQLPFTDKLLQNLSLSEFSLRRLALHGTNFNLASIPSAASTLTRLILSDVTLSEEVIDLSKFSSLKHLVFDSVTCAKDSVGVLLLSELPPYLEYLTLTGSTQVTLPTSLGLRNYEERIVFPEQDSISNRKEPNVDFGKPFGYLKSFCCLRCNLGAELWTNFHQVFPNISFLVLKTHVSVDISSLIEIPSLKVMYLETTSGNWSTFLGLSKLARNDWLTKTSTIRLERRESKWIWSDPSDWSRHQVQYSCNGGSYFWTSEEDYRSKSRLKMFEREALKTNHYKLNGRQFLPQADRNRKSLTFSGIPQEIQSQLRSIELQEVEVTPSVLSDSVKSCRNLRSLTLLNSRVVGNGLRYTFNTQNLTFVLDSAKVGNLTFEYIYEELNGRLIAGVVPFQNFGRFTVSNSTNTLDRIFHNVSSVRLELNRTVTYIFDATMAELRASYRTIRDSFLSRLPDYHRLKPMLKNLVEIQMVYRDILPDEWEFPGLQIIDQSLIKKFYQDSTAQFFGNLGIIRYLLKRYGKYLNLATLSLTAFQNQTSTFPPLQAISLSLIRGRYLTTAHR